MKDIIQAPNITGGQDRTPLISIVTVVKNNCGFIEQTLKSVLGQTYKGIEYIVVDGGSTDGTVDIIRSHETGIAKWVSEKDEGISDAFNRGLILSTGDYILFLNSDDALANPDVLAVMADEITKNNFPSLIYGGHIMRDRTSGKELCRGSVRFSSKSMQHGGVLPHPCLLTHRSFFEKYGLFDTRFKIAMDYELLLRGAPKEIVVSVPTVVTCIRDGGMSTVNRSLVVDEIIQALKKNGYLHSALSERKMRYYFSCRSFMKSALNWIGVYRAFVGLRKRLG
jgi:glycosyltransferase involved in cell wall biosynthesis